MDLDAPVGAGGVLDLDNLLLDSSDDSLELKILDIFRRLLDALSDQVNENGVAFFNGALHLHESDIVVYHIRMESDIQLQVIMGWEEPTFRADGEELMAEAGIPLEMAANITQIGQLNGAGQFGIDHHSTKANSVLQQFQLHAMGAAADLQ